MNFISRPPLDLLAFVLDTFYLDSFKMDVAKNYPKSIILAFNFKGQIDLIYNGTDIKFREKTWIFGRKNSSFLSNPFITYPIYFYQLVKIFSFVFFRFKVKKTVSENTYAAVVMGFFRLFRKSEKSFYIGVDWLATKSRKKLFSYLYCHVFFPLADFFACKLNDVTLSAKSTITARKKFWGREVANKNVVFDYWLTQMKDMSLRTDDPKKNICFLGSTRQDSGLEIAIGSIKELNKKYGIYIKIIGQETKALRSIVKKAESINVMKFINYKGFIKTEDFPTNVADCFCGINLITDKESFSKFTVPSKLVYYLQFGLPIITTVGAGLNLIPIIKNYDLGLVIKPDKESFIKAVENVYKNKNKYRQNIKNFMVKKKKEDFKKMFV